MAAGGIVFEGHGRKVVAALPARYQDGSVHQEFDETYVKVDGRWCYVYRAIDNFGALVDVLFSERRDMAAAKAFFRSAKAVTGITPDRVTTGGHDSYPRAIRTELGKAVRHRTSRYRPGRVFAGDNDLYRSFYAVRGLSAHVPHATVDNVQADTSLRAHVQKLEPRGS